MPADLFYNLKIDELSYGAPKRNKRGGYSVYVHKDKSSSENFRFQICDDDGTKPRMPFGVREPYDGTADPTRKTLELTVEDPALADFLAHLDEKNCTMATENTETWFRKKMSHEVIKSLYRPTVTEATKEGYSPLFRCKVTPKTNVYIMNADDDGEPTYVKGTMDDLQAGAEVLPIVECTGLWFMSKQFGMGFQASDLLVYPKQTRKAFDFTFKGQKPVQTTEAERSHHPPSVEQESSPVGAGGTAFDEIDANFGTMVTA